MNSSALTSTTTTPLQTSAPVSKFRCLFSHDIRRKAKRWQDGFLRFHSFNKRVMVYDTQNNFIGDLHWRDGEELNDGDELELERGVLVQVGECVEKTQTDLTELLDKRKQTSASSPARAFSPDATSRSGFVAHHNTAPNSSGRLKSLNELLGIRKTPIGRAALPSRSPYEERHQIIRPDDDGADTATERAPKRQRVNSHEQRRDFDRPPRQHPLRDSSSYSSVSNSLVSFEQARDSACNDISTTSKYSSKDAPNTTEKGPSAKSQAIIDLTNPTRSVNTLKMIIEKPRKKLMYRDLLPLQAGHRPTPKSQQSAGKTQSSVRTHKDKQPQLATEDPVAETENIPPDRPRPKPPALTATEINSTLHFVPSTSTLRALQEAEPLPSSQRTKSIDQFFKSSGQKPPPNPTIKEQKKTSPTPTVQDLQTTTTTTEGLPPKSPDKPPSPHRPFTYNHSVTTPSPSLAKDASHPAPPEPRIYPPPTIRRSDSLPALVPTERTENASPQTPPAPAPAEPKPAQPPEPKPFQRALSDASSVLVRATTSTITTAVTTSAVAPRTRQSLLVPKRNQHVATCVDVDEDDQGPWTEEALDLFDWWPAGRPKPERRKVAGR